VPANWLKLLEAIVSCRLVRHGERCAGGMGVTSNGQGKEEGLVRRE
jgi:hypothetical protein